MDSASTMFGLWTYSREETHIEPDGMNRKLIVILLYSATEWFSGSMLIFHGVMLMFRT